MKGHCSQRQRLDAPLCAGAPSLHSHALHRPLAPVTSLRGFVARPAAPERVGSPHARRHCTLLARAASSAAPQSAARQPPQSPIELTGTWVKDTGASDIESYERALDVMKLGRLQRITAARLIEGLEIRQSPYSLTVQFLTVVPFFKVTERFAFNRETSMQRRDLRGGEQRARLRATEGGLLASISWGEPHAGGVEEEFSCPEPGVLRVTSTVAVGGRSETTLQVYRRSNRWTPKNKFTLGTFGLKAPPMNIWEGH